LVAVGEGFADGESAGADGAGRTKDGKLFHLAIFADVTS
jgi:hypothetical protein